MEMKEFLSDYKAEAKEHIAQTTDAILLLEKGERNEEAINSAFRAMHTLKSMSATMGFEKLASVCHKMEDALDLVRKNRMDAANSGFVDAMLEAIDAVSAAVESTKADGEGEISFLGIEKKLAELEKSEGRANSNQKNTRTQEPDMQVEQATQSVRVPMEKLDLLLGLAGEIVINSNTFRQILKTTHAKEFRDAVNTSERLALELNEEVLNARLIEAEQVFSRFPRLARDIAKSTGKEVDFEMSGTSIELDRAILEKISGPLVHLLRNAIDHGIEPPEKRIAAGKATNGKVRLSITRQRSGAQVSVEDDGDGISAEEIKKIAIQKNIITKEQADGIKGDDAFQLLFVPGFSSSESVSKISGRGVGLNAVKNAMMQIGGVIDIKSKKGSGTRFEMLFPLSIAVVNSLVVICSGEKYALPVSYIIKSAPLKALKMKSGKRESVIFEDIEAPVIRLSDFLGSQPDKNAQNHKVLLLEIGSRKLALIVDEIAQRQGLLVKPLDKIVQKVRMFSGASVLGSGEIVLVLDVAAILEKYELNK